ncbi:MAG TPA: AAA family ATPase [Pyrinomonadaceae bacterium]|nr:AAA family ATPase [Pyrinomonadaceae bacterium]
MSDIKLVIPGFGQHAAETNIVILGPNGSGKTKLAQQIALSNQVTAISAQRRTWIDDNLPVQEEQQLLNNVRNVQNTWQQNSWQPTEEINYVLSTLVQDHTNLLTKMNEQAISEGKPVEPLTDTKLMKLQAVWKKLFPTRKLEIGGFFPKVKRLDAATDSAPYSLRQMSDGERTVLYMAARVLTAEHRVIVVDEPELHMHSRLAVQFWDEAEKLRKDCAFIYVTHDLNFTLSRRRATVLVARPDSSTEAVSVDDLPATVAAEVLGAATLPFYAMRIFFYEGEQGKGLASALFSTWFSDSQTFSMPCGDRDSVCAAVSGLKKVGVAATEITGLIDRDFYPDAVNNSVTTGVTVLPLHEIESVFCDERVVEAVAEHLGKNPGDVWAEFLHQVRKEFRAKTFNGLVARRVRSRIGDLLDGVFNNADIVDELELTAKNHSANLNRLDLPTKTLSMFDEEARRVSNALLESGGEMLAILPGKHLLSILAKVFGFKTSDFTELVLRSLDKAEDKPNPLLTLGTKVEAALVTYLPQRHSS